MSHYSALFRYQPRNGRTPLEEFLTCALVDILARLTQEQMHLVVSDLFLNEKARHDWRKLRNGHNLQWSTEYYIDNRNRCDIVIKDEAGPLLIIENKIAANFTRSRSTVNFSSKSDSDVSEGNQLVRYGQALHKMCKKSRTDWPGALVLLTHFTPPPETFVSGVQEIYGVPFTNTCKWSQIHSWLQKLRNNNARSGTPPVKFLAWELAEFLEDEDMNAETIEPEHLEAAADFISSGAASHFARSLTVIRQRLQTDIKKLTGNARTQSNEKDYFSTNGLIRDSVCFTEQHFLKNWCIEWGLCWPKSEWARNAADQGIKIPETAFWYLSVYCSEPLDIRDKRKLMQSVAQSLHSWQYYDFRGKSECGIITTCTASKFSGTGNIDDVAEWMCTELKGFGVAAVASKHGGP